jgi:hypothetical protein
MAHEQGTGMGGGYPTPPSPTWEPEDYGGYGGGGGYSKPKPLKYGDEFQWAGAPKWWRGLTPNRLTAESRYTALANAMIPFLSPEDRRATAQTLGRMEPVRKYYDNPAYGRVPSEVTSQMRQQYTSAERAKQVLEMLNKLRHASGKSTKEWGAGYQYLQQAARVLRDFGGRNGDGQTRRKQMNAAGALDPLLNSAKSGALAPYGALVQSLARPYFSAGMIAPSNKTKSGTTVYGSYNPSFAE